MTNYSDYILVELSATVRGIMSMRQRLARKMADESESFQFLAFEDFIPWALDRKDVGENPPKEAIFTTLKPEQIEHAKKHSQPIHARRMLVYPRAVQWSLKMKARSTAVYSLKMELKDAKHPHDGDRRAV